MPETVKRPYRSPARESAAAATRARIREAASRLFIEQGYAATTLRQIAKAAGVGERTLYDAFASKAALFMHTLSVATVGDEEPVAVAARPEITGARRETDAGAAIAQHVTYSADLLDRAGDLIMVGVEAMGADADMRAASEAGSEATHRVHLAFAESLHARGALRPQLDPAGAADVLYGLLSPHMHHLLRRDRGWSPERYRTWLRDTVTRELLG